MGNESVSRENYDPRRIRQDQGGDDPLTKERGFTFIELITSVFLLGLVATLVVPIWKELSYLHHYIISLREARLLLQKEAEHFSSTGELAQPTYESQFYPLQSYYLSTQKIIGNASVTNWKVEVRWKGVHRGWKRLELIIPYGQSKVLPILKE